MSSFSTELVAQISEKTRIKPKLVIVILELFVFILKRVLIDEKRVYIRKIGCFALVSSKSKWRKKISVKFKSVDYMKSVLKGSKELVAEHSCDSKVYKYFKKIALVLGLKNDEVKYLFNLFFYHICLQLLQNNVYKINRFGTLFITNSSLILKTKLATYLKTKYNSDINCKVIKFKVVSSFKKEIEGKITEIKISSRVKRLLYLSKIDYSTKLLV